MSAYFSDHEVPWPEWTLGSSNLAGKHEGRDSRFLGATALEAVGAITPADYRKVVPYWSRTWYR